MERLTERKRNNDGTGISINSLVIENGIKKGMPSGYCSRIVTRLADYEDLEEQGKLLKLPCKVGDKVFIPIDFQRKIYQGVVTGIEYSKIRKGFVAKIRTIDEGVCYEKLEDFGNTVFLTHEEADINLSEMIRKESENK